MEAESLQDMLCWTAHSVPLLPGSVQEEKAASAQWIHKQIGVVTAKSHGQALAPG